MVLSSTQRPLTTPDTPNSGTRRRLARRRTLVLAVLGAALLAWGVASYAFVSPGTASWLTDVAWAAFSLAAAVRSFATAGRTGRGAERRAWLAFGTAAALWFAGMAYLIAGQLRDPGFAPYPTPANWLFLAFAPTFALGLFWLSARRPLLSISLKRLAELGLIVTATTVGTLIVLFEPLAGASGSPLLRFFSVADPAAFLSAALFALTCLWLADLGRVRPVFWILTAAIGLHALADALYFQRVVAPRPGQLPLEALWLVAFALQYWAAWEHSRRPAARRSPPPPEERGTRRALEPLLPALLIVALLALALVYRDLVSVRLLIVAAPVIALFTVFLGARSFAIDRHERELFERLKASIALPRKIMRASPAVAFVCPPDGDFAPTFVSANLEAELGFGHREGSSWRPRVHPEDAPLVAAGFERVLAEGRATLEYRLRHGDGTYRWVYQRMVVARGEDGRPREIVGSLMDISGRKELEERLIESERIEALGRLSGGIAHEFNNVLTVILGYAELAQLEPATPEPVRGYLGTIGTAAGRASRLTEQLVSYSSRHALERETLDLARLVDERRQLLAGLVGEDVELEIRSTNRAATVSADRRLLEQVLMTLVANACQELGDGGRVTVEVDRVVLGESYSGPRGQQSAGPHVVLAVADNGPGLSSEEQSRLFEPFAPRVEGRGPGLALASVHGIVRQHDGYIRVDSESGSGTVFRVFLPETVGEEAVPAAAAGVPVARGAVGDATLLVVDDEPAIVELLRGMLAPLGYRVLTAGSAEEALARFEEDGGFDLLLTDVLLPGKNGRELAERLTAAMPGLTVVYMSGWIPDAGLQGVLEAADAPLLRKPISYERLTSAVEEALAARRRRQPG